jgi:hypothetical protein
VSQDADEQLVPLWSAWPTPAKLVRPEPAPDVAEDEDGDEDGDDDVVVDGTEDRDEPRKASATGIVRR